MRATIVSAFAFVLVTSGAQADQKLIAFGEHLSRECSACHRREQAGAAIPPIFGLAPDYFAKAMEAYRSGERRHEIMNAVSRSLEQDEITALAAYFATQTPDSAGR